ncbi:MAG: M48 family metallopeptidase [Verrucomicrobiota bacterium]
MIGLAERAMDFFERQDKARSRSGLLLIYFVVAVVGIIAAVYVAAVLIRALFLNYTGQHTEVMLAWWNPVLFWWVVAGTVTVIGLASLSKIFALRGGGAAVAMSLGGQRVNPYAVNRKERQLLNVVEEMALASGTRIPEVFILPEEGINAFAAGYSPDDAAIGVTRGCLDKLSRDELQGVIAHEFSHILNGDMRMNIRLIGVLYGILVLAVIGGMILRSMRFTRVSGGSSRRGGKGDGGGAILIAIMLTAVALFAIGHIGVFFGRLIQSAVSRQREFLADASAVQFTRNPSGIADALKRIGGASFGSRIESGHAQETAHFFFANALKHSFGSFATHPPLPDRILAIEPGWDGKFLRKSRRKEAKPPPKPKPKAKGTFNPADLILMVGVLSADSLQQAQQLRERLEARFGTYTRNPLAARALLFSLVLDADDGRREAQITYLNDQGGDELEEVIRLLYPRLQDCQPQERLSLAELCLPSLNQLSAERAEVFLNRLRHVIELDGKVTVGEFVICRLARVHFARRKDAARSPGHYTWSLLALVEPLSQLLSAVIHLGTDEASQAERNFTQVVEKRLKALRNAVKLLPAGEIDFASLDEALDALAAAAYGLRRQVLQACGDIVAIDGEINAKEAQLLRAVSLSLDCPMPPIKD